MNRIDLGIKKLEITFLKEAKRWARCLTVKQKGMNITALSASFSGDGYTLGNKRMGSELEMWLIRNRDKKIIKQGTVYLDIDIRKDTPYYEGN